MTARRPWWKRKWWWAAAVFWLAGCYLVGVGPAVYVCRCGWLSRMGNEHVEAAYAPVWLAGERFRSFGAAMRRYTGWWYELAVRDTGSE